MLNITKHLQDNWMKMESIIIIAQPVELCFFEVQRTSQPELKEIDGLTLYLIEMPFNTFVNRADPDQAALVRAA